MATSFTVGAGNYIRPYRNVRIVSFPEGGTQSFRIGDPVILETTSDKGNQVVIAGTDPLKVTGFAAQAATGTQGTAISVWAATPEAEFVGHVQDTGVLDNDLTGTAKGLVADGTNHIWRVDISETTTTACHIIKLLDAHGDTNGRVIFKVLAAYRQIFD